MVLLIKAGLNMMGIAVVIYLGAIAWGFYTAIDKNKAFKGLRTALIMMVIYLVIRKIGMDYANTL